MITLTQVAGLVTVQDTGRTGHRGAGVSPGGALDVRALMVANAIVGNAPHAAALEGCLSAATLQFAHDGTIALTGAEVAATLDGASVATYEVIDVRAGSALRIEQCTRGAVWYVAVRGGLDTPEVLGSRATLVSAGLGGAPLKAGATFPIGAAVASPSRRAVPNALRTPLDAEEIAWLPGTALDLLAQPVWHQFFRSTWRVSHTSSRTGYRFDGDPLTVTVAADRASEPTCAGAMQLPPDGRPIVLMAEHPTIGGYPVIGVVPATALGALAQRPPGSVVRFTPTTADEVLEARRQWSHTFTTFRQHA